MKVLAGSLLETRYAWPDNNEELMEETGSDLHNTDAVTYISDKIGLHRMGNPSHSASTVTLHLYTPPFAHCRVFDQRTGRSSATNITFEQHTVGREERSAVLGRYAGYRGCTLYLTGLSGAGKTTIAFAVEKALTQVLNNYLQPPILHIIRWQFGSWEFRPTVWTAIIYVTGYAKISGSRGRSEGRILDG